MPGKRRRSSHAPAAPSSPAGVFALDELFLRVLGQLDAPDLARAQGVSRHWARMALDPQLWKRLYLDRYPHPHHSRLVYTRTSGASTPLRPLARLPSRAFPPPSPSPSPVDIALVASGKGSARAAIDRESLATDHVVRNDGIDWKAMMRLGTNWSNGNARSEASVSLPPSPVSRPADQHEEDEDDTPPYTPHHLALFPAFICTSSPASPLVHVYAAQKADTTPPSLGIIPPPPGWSSPARPDNVTAICADQAVVQAEDGSLPARVVIFYASGGFAVVRLRLDEGRLVWTRESVSNARSRPRRRGAPPGADPVVLAALNYPVLLTCSLRFHLSVYLLSDAPPVLLRALHSEVSFHPAALSLFPPVDTKPGRFRAALTYSTPIYPSSWTVAVQELGISLSPSGAGAIHRGECYRVGGAVRDDAWPRRLNPLVGVRGDAVGVGTDGRWCVLAGGSDSVIHVYSLPTPHAKAGDPPPIVHAQTLLAPTVSVTSVSLASGRCVSGGRDGRVLVWELDEGEDGEDGARVGRTVGFVEVQPGGRRRRLDVPPDSEGDTDSDDDDNLPSSLPHPAAISTAARQLFLATPPASLRPAAAVPRSDLPPAIRQLAFDEQKIVALADDHGVDVMRVWSFA
ncbi:hypothetical protein Q8F55_000955 [Vanrija albida]|uniref:F-box domain-containing protein n=1 Tax=Vanrija albida TaxID=181172 RepID=A0ABR3QEQ9_9TREE